MQHHHHGNDFEQLGNDPCRFFFKQQEGHQKHWFHKLEADKHVYNIVLDGADEQYGQGGWSLDVFGDKDSDKRDDVSNRLAIRNSNQGYTAFKLVPKDNGSAFSIRLADDPHQTNRLNAIGACHYWFDYDKRDDDSYRAMLHQDDGIANTDFEFVPSGDGKTFYIQMKSCNTEVTKGVDLTKWKLAAHRYYDEDKRDDNSTYAFFHSNPPNGCKWRIVRDQDPMRNRPLFRCDASTKNIRPSTYWAHTLETDKYVYNIVLDGADEQYGQAGWGLDVFGDKKSDQRDDCSTRLVLAKPHNGLTAWRLIPRENGTYFSIVLAEDPHSQGSNRTGSIGACHYWFDQDKRDDTSYRGLVHTDVNIKNTFWTLYPDENGYTFSIRLFNCDTEVTKGVDLNGYHLAAHRYYDEDKRDDNSTYAFFHQDPPNGCKWRLYRDLNPLRN